MTAVSNLSILLKSMKPELAVGEYVFCSVPSPADLNMTQIVAFFREKEGVTLILSGKEADDLGLNYEQVFAWITLTVHSSLTAAGLTAAFSAALAENNISCNVVAGFYHDHLFVPYTDAGRAMNVLQELQQSAAKS